ncbi:DUF2938 domain-containing protein [Tenacibaculum caenipelagi]|uniref:DUF2938 family protein n=1 Tax=Tenacibaculum caenipelagi TaxID=1325435 RepID=A0A4V3D2U7_9FLAO|nr:DUF2938 domain-containing protein [Tenacibaculum caenipelagi]TDQ23795.1 DUF2938 family protein [Tenacibaculum caenipelagi]
MNHTLQIIIIGIGATLTMDIWASLLSLFNIKSLDYRFVGRWLGHLTKGKLKHDKIFNTKPFPYELIIGWIAHYLIGITFTFLLVIIYGKDWLNTPTLQPAIIIGLTTVVAPFFIMQPSFGIGIAASKLPNANIARFKSLVTHFIFGLGIYLTAMLF